MLLYDADRINEDMKQFLALHRGGDTEALNILKKT